MKKLRDVLADVLEINSGDITDETSPDTVETWDSYNGLLMVSELEDNFKVKFTMSEVRSVTTVKDIKEILVKHGVTIED
jgi:acyl carrier protein